MGVIINEVIYGINLPPGSTVPQSCSVKDVNDPSLSTRTTPWLSPDRDKTPRPVAVDPGLPGLIINKQITIRSFLSIINNVIYLLNDTVNVSDELAQGQSDSGIKPLLSNAFKNASHADNDPGKW